MFALSESNRFGLLPDKAAAFSKPPNTPRKTDSSTTVLFFWYTAMSNTHK